MIAMATDPKNDLTAIGPLAAELGASVRRIERAAAKLKMAPALRLSGVPYFDAVQIEKLRKAVGSES